MGRLGPEFYNGIKMGMLSGIDHADFYNGTNLWASGPACQAAIGHTDQHVICLDANSKVGPRTKPHKIGLEIACARLFCYCDGHQPFMDI